MTDVSCQQDDWNVPCSDDENYGVHGKVSINFCVISLCLYFLNSFVFLVWRVELIHSVACGGGTFKKLLCFMCTPLNTRKVFKETSLRDFLPQKSVEILGYHGSECEDNGRLECGAAWVGRLFSWCKRNEHLRLFCRTDCYRH
jgi:hypothetical protein